MKKLPLLLFVVGCAYEAPDPRQADVSVPPEWESEYTTAVDWWNAASDGGLDWRVAPCSEARACVRVVEGSVSDDGANATTRVEEVNGSRNVTITLDPTMSSKLRLRVVAHEVGHALDIDHADDWHDVMFYTSAPFEQCLGPETHQAWVERYGKVSWTSFCQ